MEMRKSAHDSSTEAMRVFYTEEYSFAGLWRHLGDPIEVVDEAVTPHNPILFLQKKASTFRAEPRKTQVAPDEGIQRYCMPLLADKAGTHEIIALKMAEDEH